MSFVRLNFNFRRNFIRRSDFWISWFSCHSGFHWAQAESHPHVRQRKDHFHLIMMESVLSQCNSTWTVWNPRRTIIHGVERNRKSIWNVGWIGKLILLVRLNIRGLMLRDSLRNLGYDHENVREEMKKGKQNKEIEHWDPNTTFYKDLMLIHRLLRVCQCSWTFSLVSSWADRFTQFSPFAYPELPAQQ